MLNYTSKIQHFLNLHRKHTKYIVVLLLLSAFVASFVCSALTEPAVSMTEPIQMGQNVTLLADGQTDGLPKLTYNYSANESQFKEYIYWNADWESNIRPDHLFGSAHNFGMFAFDTINVGSSCNSNLAAPNLELGHTFGLGSIADNGGQEITVATNSVKLNSSLTSRNTVLLFPENINFINEQGKPVNINPLPRVQLGGNHLEKGNSAVYAYHVTSNFINFEEEQGKFKQLQQKLIHETSDTVTIKNYYNEERIERVTVSTEGINYLTIPWDRLPDGSRAINFEIENNAALIINVDLSGAPADYKTGFQVNGKVNGLDFQKDDKASINGVNILWNFYDSSQTENQYSGSITFDNPGYGCILAPSATVTLSATYAGNIVANNINAGATVNKAMFMTGIEATSSFIALMAAKEWNDGNENHSSDYVTFQLYKSSVANANINDLTETVGDPVEVRSTDNWNYTWFNLDQSYYYYVKEVASGTIGGNPFICDTEYTNNGGNQTGTITVKNKKVDSSNIDTSATLNLTVKMYWSDNAEAHAFCVGNNGCKYENEYKCTEKTERHKNKTVVICRTTDPNFNFNNIGNLSAEQKENLMLPDDFANSNGLNNDHDTNHNTSTMLYSNENWQLTINNLPVYDNSGQLYYYYAHIPYGNGYTFAYSNNGISRNDNTVTVGCIKLIKLTVNKVWSGESKNSATFEVYRSMTKQQTIPSDAVKIEEYAIQNNNNVWQTIVSDLPQSDIYANKYYYYIKETKVNWQENGLNDYNISYTTNSGEYPFNDHGEMTITNERKQAGNVSIKVAKRMTVLHGTSKAVLYYSNDSGANWTKLSEQTLSEANNWQCTFINLPKAVTVDNQTKQRSYRVLEEDTPYGFNASYSGNDVLAYSSADNTIHNVYINNNEKKVSLNIKKFWENINDDIIDYVKIRVYQVKSTDYQMAQTLLLNNSLTFNSYINMLNGSSNPTINGNTATYTGLSFAPVTASDYNHEIRIDLSQFAGNMLINFKIVFNSNAPIFSPEGQSGTPNHYIILGNGGKQGLWNQNALNGNYYTSDCSIKNGTHLIITSYENVTYEVSSLELTFQNEITTGGSTTPSEPEQGENTGSDSNSQTVNLGALNFEANNYSNDPYNIRVSMKPYAGRKISSVEIVFTSSPNVGGYILCGTLDNNGGITNNYFGEGYSAGDTTRKIQYNGDKVITDEYLVITANSSYSNQYQVSSISITFADSGSNVIHESDTFTATPSADYTYKIVEKFSAYSDKLVTEIKSYYYSKANDAHDYQSGYNLYAGNDGDGYIESDSSKSSWNEYIQTQGYNNENLTQVTFKAKYPDNLQKIIVTYSDGSTFTLNNTAWNNKIHYSDSIQFNSASGNGTDKMSGSDNTYNILSNFSSYNEKTVKSIYTYFYGLDSNGKNNSTLHEHTFNTWARGNVNGETGGYIDDYSSNNNWNGDARVKEYTEENGKNINGFSVQTRYANNVEKVVVNYTDGSTFILYNSNYNGNLETIYIPTESTADHDSRDWGFNTGYAGQQIWIENSNFHSKEVDYVEMYFNNQITQFPDWKVYDIWLGDYNNPIGTRSQDSYYQKDSYWVAKWNYTNATSVSQIGARTVNYTDVQKLVITYTDQSTYTINNSNAQFSTSDYVTYDYYFENGNQLTMTPTSYHTLYIPENFQYKAVQKIEAHFANLQTFDLSNFDSEILNMWVKGKDGYDFWSNSYEKKTSDGNVLIKNYANADYNNRQNISEIVVVPTKYTQNLEKVVVTFDSGSITINNKSYNSSAFEVGSGNQNTTAAPQQPVITYTTTIYVESAPFVTVSGSDYGKMNNENRVTFTIPEQFKTRIIKSLDITFYNYASLERKDPNVPYYDSVINVYVDQWSEDWDNGQSGWSDAHLIKTYTDGKGRGSINYLYICTAYTQNLEQIVITFTDGSTITISNSGYNANNLATSPIPLTPTTTTTTTTTPSDGFMTEIILTQTNGEWKTTLNDLPMVAPDGTPYYYFIVEVEIGVKSEYQSEYGTTYPLNKFDITYSPAYLELSDKQENILAVTNSLKLTNVNMPSTGGIGTHPYRNAGILMMICSGGIYISLRALRKKQN